MNAELPLSAPAPAAELRPITSLDDPRVVQILSTEHWSLLSARSLAYNETFARGGMFLTFLSMSFVAMALLAQAMAFGSAFLAVTAIVLAMDFVIGVLTYVRNINTNREDSRAVWGMARIRHAYTQIAPIVTPYFTTPYHDDPESVLLSYGAPPNPGIGQLLLYGVTTSGGMIGLIASIIAGVLASDLALLAGASVGPAVGIGVVGTVAVFAIMTALTIGSVTRARSTMPPRFPAERVETDA